MRQLYSFFLYLFTPILLLRLWWKGKKSPAYSSRVHERFFLNQSQRKSVDIWIHAVSLGEVVAATPIIQALLEKNHSILVTTMTPTGSQQVEKQFADRVQHFYLPYDLPWVIKRFYKHMRPQLGIIMETELWPNLIYFADKMQIPLLLANARLSDKSIVQYEKAAFFFKPVLNQLKVILAQSEQDANRFISLGADAGRVQVVGNIKFDIPYKPIDLEKFEKLKNQWGSQRPALIAASTHSNEEQQILSELKTLQQSIPNLILLIAPRHPERFDLVYQLCLDEGWKTGLRSDPNTISPDNEVIILNSLGELNGFYRISDYAFVGGSLVPIGGHNVLEPIMAKIPVFTGPYMQNSKEICDELVLSGGLEKSADLKALIESIVKVHNNEEIKLSLTNNATSMLERNKGSIGRYLEMINKLMNKAFVG